MEGEEDFRRDNDVEVHIPEELAIEEILSRLPIKHVYKFRSVCKLWESLPYDSKFVELHNRRSATASTLIILSYKAEGDHSILSFYSLDITENGSTSKLMSSILLKLDIYHMEPSCSGLICFSSKTGQDIYVGNPSTHEFFQLPNLLEHSFADTEATSPCMVAGFGFDNSSGKYKVLCAYEVEHLGKWKCFIFSLGSIDSKWRQVDDIPWQIQPIHSAFVNGAVHWLIENDDSYSPDGILAFSFEEEKCQLLPLPSGEIWDSYMGFYERHSYVYLQALEGHLHLVTTLHGPDAGFLSLNFWTLTDYIKRVWTFDYCIKFPIFDEFLNARLPVPVDIQNGKVLFSSERRLYIHDIKEMTTMEVNCEFPGEDALNNVKCFQPNHGEKLVCLW